MVSTPSVCVRVLGGGGISKMAAEVRAIYRRFRNEARKRAYLLSFSHLGPRCLLSLEKEEGVGLPHPEAEQARRHLGPPDGRSGCSPAEPYPPAGFWEITKGKGHRPGPNHPWRRSFKKK